MVEGSNVNHVHVRYNLSYIIQQGALNGKPVLGVSINYRMAAFGFLDSEEVRVSCLAGFSLLFHVIDFTG
jgi:carboxylesterase type B